MDGVHKGNLVEREWEISIGNQDSSRKLLLNESECVMPCNLITVSGTDHK